MGGCCSGEGEEVKVKSVEYRSDDAMDLARFLITADIRLVRAEFLWSLCEAKGVIPRRQEADQKCFETLGTGKQTALVEHEEVEAWAAGRREALICSISHCWESREHSDPCGHQLQIISDCTRLYAEAYDAPVWVFLDQVSLFQFKRTEEQDRSFRLGMGHMHLLYCHEYTMTLRVHSISSDQEWEQLETEGHVVDIYDADSDVVRAVPLNKLTRNQNQYLARGWCQAEYEWSSTRAHTAGNQRIDVSQDEPALKGKVPMMPVEFRKRLDQLKFTHRADSEAVCHLQEKVFFEKVTTCKDLKLEFLDKDACQVLAESLPYYENLETFALLDFTCSDPVLEKLLTGLNPRLTGNALKALHFKFSQDNQRHRDMILLAVAQVLPQNSSLTSLRVPGEWPPKGWDGEGPVALAKAMNQNTMLVDVVVYHYVDDATRARLESWDPPPPWRDAVFAIQDIAERNTRNAASRNVAPEATATRRPMWPPVKLEPLAQLLKKNSALTELQMAGKCSGPIQIQGLARAIQGNKTMIRIYLANNEIGDAGAQVLAEVLKVNETVKGIHLAGNQIRESGARALAEALEKNKTVKYIDLRWNQIGDVGAQALAEALKRNNTVTMMALDGNEIGDAGAQALAEALKESNAVTKMTLGTNQISDAGAQALAEVLKESNTVTEMTLHQNKIRDAGAQALAEALKENKAVTNVSLYGNLIGDAGAQALAEALKKNKTVTMIMLSLNQIGAAGGKALAEAAKENGRVWVKW